MMQADPGGQEFAPALTEPAGEGFARERAPADAIARAERAWSASRASPTWSSSKHSRDAPWRTRHARDDLLRALHRDGRRARAHIPRRSAAAPTSRWSISPSSSARRANRRQAIELLERCLREYPRFVGSVLPYASALMASGRPADEAVAEVERHVPDLTPAARFLLGSALYEAGATAAGEAQFRAVLARQPHSCASPRGAR